jgi:hypothetical protein
MLLLLARSLPYSGCYAVIVDLYFNIFSLPKSSFNPPKPIFAVNLLFSVMFLTIVVGFI